MERYFKRKQMLEPDLPLSSTLEVKDNDCGSVQSSSKKSHVDVNLIDLATDSKGHVGVLADSRSHAEVNLADLPADPGLRIRISDFHPNDQDSVRIAYLQKGPYQPHDHKFPQKQFGKQKRRFNPAWFKEYGSWLEYSIVKDAAFCLHCYLFGKDNGEQGGGNSFVLEGFTNWKKKEKLQIHVGGYDSAHNQAYRKSLVLLNKKQHIQAIPLKQSDQAQKDYRVWLNASIDCIRFLLRQGLMFHGHEEFDDSFNHGNFLELLHFLVDHNEDIRSVVLQNASDNLKLIAPDIQKDIMSAISIETTKVIINELGDALFAILIDGFHDMSNREQMVVILRYVDKRGCVIEHLLGIVHVSKTTALSLKVAIETLFSSHGLNLMRLRGQSYDGTSDMRDEFNGLKTLIMEENESAFYVYCFAHQLQSVLVAAAKNHIQISFLFSLVSRVMKIVGVSCKRHDIVRVKKVYTVVEALKDCELSSRQGLDQETNLKQFGDTRWGSYYETLTKLIFMFSSVVDVLEFFVEDDLDSEQRGEASFVLQLLLSFDFAFSLHLMKNVLEITNDLSKALQRKEQNIIDAINLVKMSKQRLQIMRDTGWDSFLDEVSSFCAKHDITVPDMGDNFVDRGRSLRRAEEIITNLHHYRVKVFYNIIGMQVQELNNIFTETNTELLICVACFDPSGSFSSFDKGKLVRLAQFYPYEFSAIDLVVLDNQLETYILDMRSNNEFLDVKGISGLAQKMVEKKKDVVYPLVYLLMTLALILPVATATVERAFSAMHTIKDRLHNQMGDDWTNDCLITYIEKDIFNSIDNETIMQCFQRMKTREGYL